MSRATLRFPDAPLASKKIDPPGSIRNRRPSGRSGARARQECANTGRSPMARGTRQIDPLQTFEIERMNGGKREKADLRRKRRLQERKLGEENR